MKIDLRSKNSELIPYRIWDFPIRFLHWALVLFIALSWWSAESGFHKIHVLSGYIVLTLALIRLYWGFYGSASARFGNFVRGPQATWSYARQIFSRPGIISSGHNPMGALSVLAMLGLLLTQPLLGLFAKDIDGLHSGPLSHLVSFKVGRVIAQLHYLLFELLIIFIVIHFLAVIFYVLYKRHGIILAMISGYKKLPPGSHKEALFVPLWRAVIALGVAIILMLSLHFIAAELK